MKTGFPSVRKDDLRYYLDQDGRFTSGLRLHYEPLRRQDGRRAFLKIGSSWMDVPFDLLAKGNVFRLLDDDGKFVTWADDGSPDMLAMEDPIRNQAGVWGVRTRKPTAQEMADV